MSSKKKDNSVGPWAREKLDALRQYLSSFTTVLKKQGHWLKGTYFVDAFAGPGLSKVRKTAKAASLFFPEEEPEQEEYLKGSPRVALEIANPFSSYLFIDNDKQRVAELEALKKEHAGTANILVIRGDANAELQRWLASRINWKQYRGVVFLDPFGTQLSWTTIEAIAQTGGVGSHHQFSARHGHKPNAPKRRRRSGRLADLARCSFWIARLAQDSLPRRPRPVWPEAAEGERYLRQAASLVSRQAQETVWIRVNAKAD